MPPAFKGTIHEHVRRDAVLTSPRLSKSCPLNSTTIGPVEYKQLFGGGSDPVRCSQQQHGIPEGSAPARLTGSTLPSSLDIVSRGDALSIAAPAWHTVQLNYPEWTWLPDPGPVRYLQYPGTPAPCGISKAERLTDNTGEHTRQSQIRTGRSQCVGTSGQQGRHGNNEDNTHLDASTMRTDLTLTQPPCSCICGPVMKPGGKELAALINLDMTIESRCPHHLTGLYRYPQGSLIRIHLSHKG